MPKKYLENYEKKRKETEIGKNHKSESIDKYFAAKNAFPLLLLQTAKNERRLTKKISTENKIYKILNYCI